jgi:hypothetical protein
VHVKSAVVQKRKGKGCLIAAGIVLVLAIIGGLASKCGSDPTTQKAATVPLLVGSPTAAVIKGLSTTAANTSIPGPTATRRLSETPPPTVTPITTGTAQPTGTLVPTAANAPTPEGGGTVYITSTGTRYHRAVCSTVKDGSTPVTCEWAKANGYDACKVCNPVCP